MKILVADKISDEGLGVLSRSKKAQVEVKPGLDEQALAEAVADAEGLVIRSGAKVTAKVIVAASRLKVIGRAGVGVDNVDLEAATERGIVVMNTPDGNTIAAAEHTFGLLLACARNIPVAHDSLKSGKWERSKFVGTELNGKTIGIVGLGRIGCNVARYAQAFRMKVIAYDPFIARERAEEADIEIVGMEELFQAADFITLHTPVTDKTRGMVNRKLLSSMKPTARLINCARGALVDEDALEQALSEGEIAGAALDVFSSEPPDNPGLIGSERVVVTPHLGASTKEAQIGVGVQIAHQVLAALEKGAYDNAVNMPLSDPSLLEHFQPFLNLTERIGVFLAEFLSGGVRKVEITAAGSCSDALQPLKLSLLKGLLSPVTGGNVNFINAALLARQRGIQVEGTITDKADYTNLVRCTVTTDKESACVEGTVFGDEL
ncbi:MAG: phosphoglycerate dehydrogenase, partial [Gemmatimonadota bacterium]|nr:phosphoglycerate dehydrogenase [Gemmatimonadota bacterium]